MPFKSDAQRKALYAAAAGHSTLGISQEGAKKFIAHSKNEGATNLPEHVSKKRKLKGKRKKAK